MRPETAEHIHQMRPESDWSGRLETVPDSLTPRQFFRLVEIAHETKDEGVRKAALELFMKQAHPPMVFHGGVINDLRVRS